MGCGDGRSLFVIFLSIVIYKCEIYFGGFVSLFCFLKVIVSKYCLLGDFDVKFFLLFMSCEEDVVCMF